jgi:cardiolipin synthase
MTVQEIQWVTAFSFLAYCLGWISSYHVIMSRRSSQAVIAWSVTLCTFPFLGLPMYWIFGRTKFNGYVDARRDRDEGTSQVVLNTLSKLPDSIVDPEDLVPDQRVMEKLAAMPYTHFNQLELTLTGEETFAAIFESMRSARSYILIQYYLIRDDSLGRRLLQEVALACKRGVRVSLLYDEIGCTRLGKRYLRDFKKTGATLSGFRTTRGPKNRFQLNFRNHRKIVVIDGTTAFVGGYNVGDEYLGRHPKLGAWRDTHCKIQGPAALAVQLSFVSDWYWAREEIPEVMNWEPQRAPDQDQRVLVVPSGPADDVDTWKLMLLQCIRQSDNRFWLVSPYFVPDGDIISALQLAALRGVDIRIMLPNKPDHLLVWLASFSLMEQMTMDNIHFYRYTPGFLHQKVVLVDEELAIVGTANADNRSFALNFEISITGIDPDFIQQVETMLVEDFSHCRQVGAEEYWHHSLLFRFSVKLSRLMAPIL